MNKDKIYIPPEDIEIITSTDYSKDLSKYFSNTPVIVNPLLENTKKIFNKIEKMLYSTPTFINTVKSIIPEYSYLAIFTNDQKMKIATGALNLMTKKDGSLMANLIDPKTKKIISTISLEKIKLSPEISQAITNFSTNMQLMQIAEQINSIQIAIEAVHQGQEHDRLATAYSCQQKLIQAISLKNLDLKKMALLRIVSDAEDSRNLLMLSQIDNVSIIKKKP